MSDEFRMPTPEDLARLPWNFLIIEATGLKAGDPGPMQSSQQRQFIGTPYQQWLLIYEPHPKKPRMTMTLKEQNFGLLEEGELRMTPEAQLFHNVIYLAQICVQERWTGAKIVEGDDRSKRLFGAFMVVNKMKCPGYKKDKVFIARNQDILENAYQSVINQEWPAPEMPKKN